MADMKAMMRESAKAKREMEEMRRKAEADLDEILDEAIAEFEAEEDLTEKPEDDEGERMETLLAGEAREAHRFGDGGGDEGRRVQSVGFAGRQFAEPGLQGYAGDDPSSVVWQ